MRRFASAVVAVAFVVSFVQVGVPAAHAGTASLSYLALGDSLSVGHQPGRGNTPNGYVDDLQRRFVQTIPGLFLRNVGCIGETSRSLIGGKSSLCHYGAGSQLNAAVAFLEAHPNQVAFVTIDIGANDLINQCLQDSGLIERACAVGLLPTLQARVTHIVEALDTAAGGTAPIVGMTYYDPLLGLWGLVPGGRAVARADQRAWSVFNAGLASAYRTAGAAVADVSKTFRTHDFWDTTVVPGRGRLPVNVARVCTWTWFCSPRFFTDFHANPTGYRKIATTFERKLKSLMT
jgi:lysophospholipase L1-like esterase